MAKDLRLIITLLKVINELESMGDLAESISKKSKSIPASQYAESRIDLDMMGETTLLLVKKSLDSLFKEDVNLAREVLQLDDTVDQMHAKHHHVVAEDIERDDLEFTHGKLGLLSVSRSLERIGDNATNIAEDVIYLVEARIIRHGVED